MTTHETSTQVRYNSPTVQWAKVTGRLSRLFLYVLVLGLTVVFMFPFLWTISSSLKPVYEMYEFPPTMFPRAVQWQNYVQVLTVVPYGRWMWNSTFLVLLAMTGQVLSATIAAYSFARFDYPGKDILFSITLSTMMIPLWVTLIPQYLIFRQLQWLDSLLPLWVPMWFGGGAFYIFLMRQFILTLPRELDEAAYIDGASPLRIFWSLILPLCRPALTTAAVISAIFHWNNFMGPLVYLNSTEKFVLALGLNYFKTYGGGGDIPRDNLLMAASLIATIPPILLFFTTQRYFVQGVALSGLKG